MIPRGPGSTHAVIVGSILALLFTPTVAPAQATRAEAIAAQQAEKADRVGPEEAGTAERVVVRVLSSSLLAATDGVHPWFGSVYPGAGFGAGVGYLARYPYRMRLSLASAASVSGSTLLDASFSGPALARGTLTPRLSANLTRVKGLSYFGPGPDSVRDNRVPFDFTPMTVGAGLTFAPVSWFAIEGDYRALHIDTAGGAEPLLMGAPGFEQDLRYRVPRGSVSADWRPASGYATHGGLLRASVARYDEGTDRPHDFRQVELEAIQLVPLVREQFVLAFHGLATFTDTDPGHAVPFVLLPTVGSGRTVRGYANRRFADENRLVLTGEYRWRPSRHLDMAVFLDAGHVAAHRRDLALDRLKTAWGLGARIHGPSFTALRFDVARSREGLTFVFAAGPPF